MQPIPTSPVIRVAAVLVAAATGLSACGGDEPSEPITTPSSEQTVEPGPEPTADGTSPGPSPTEEPTDTEADEGVVAAEVEVQGGQPVGGLTRIPLTVGDTLRLTVTSDEAYEVHVHGFDVFGDVAPGEPVVLEVPIEFPGVFEVELEGAHVKIAELEVSS